jgi:hypothetical protein
MPLPGWLTGVVTDRETGSPISGVTVRAKDASGAVYGPARTASNGLYLLALPAGTYTVKFRHSYYDRHKKRGVTIPEGGARQLDVRLT